MIWFDLYLMLMAFLVVTLIGYLGMFFWDKVAEQSRIDQAWAEALRTEPTSNLAYWQFKKV